MGDDLMKNESLRSKEESASKVFAQPLQLLDDLGVEIRANSQFKLKINDGDADG